ncbi:MAG: hypothetical protein HY689_08580 [Chloroflexi bacterium]|nr:hypothetical protein [Chloroflexota bacterium]
MQTPSEVELPTAERLRLSLLAVQAGDVDESFIHQVSEFIQQYHPALATLARV